MTTTPTSASLRENAASCRSMIIRNCTVSHTWPCRLQVLVYYDCGRLVSDLILVVQYQICCHPHGKDCSSFDSNKNVRKAPKNVREFVDVVPCGSKTAVEMATVTQHTQRLIDVAQHSRKVSLHVLPPSTTTTDSKTTVNNGQKCRGICLENRSRRDRLAFKITLILRTIFVLVQRLPRNLFIPERGDAYHGWTSSIRNKLQVTK